MENPQGHWAMATACLAIRIYRQIYQGGNHKEMPQKPLKGLFAVLNLISGNPVFINDDICKKNKKCMNGMELRMAQTVTINRSLVMVPGSNE